MKSTYECYSILTSFKWYKSVLLPTQPDLALLVYDATIL